MILNNNIFFDNILKLSGDGIKIIRPPKSGDEEVNKNSVNPKKIKNNNSPNPTVKKVKNTSEEQSLIRCQELMSILEKEYSKNQIADYIICIKHIYDFKKDNRKFKDHSFIPKEKEKERYFNHQNLDMKHEYYKKLIKLYVSLKMKHMLNNLIELIILNDKINISILDFNEIILDNLKNMRSEIELL